MHRILIVDDDHDLANLWAKVLDDYLVDVANDGNTALEMYAAALISAPYSLIILDLSMPFQNGYDVRDKIRAAGGDVKIVFITAYPEHLNPERPQGSELWRKPMSVLNFRAGVQRILGE